MEKRTIKISLKTAKEWYKGDNNALKELALQAFTETELKAISCVKSWEEFCKKYNRKNEYYINQFSEATPISDLFCNYPRSAISDKNLLATKEDVEAFLSFIQLKRLRDQWWESLNWKPDYKNAHWKYTIIIDANKIDISEVFTYHRFLTFPTKEIAEDFLNCFRDLIEKTKELI